MTKRIYPTYARFLGYKNSDGELIPPEQYPNWEIGSLILVTGKSISRRFPYEGLLRKNGEEAFNSFSELELSFDLNFEGKELDDYL